MLVDSMLSVKGRIAMAQIEIEGKKYKVLDNLNYVHEVGGYVKEVETPSGPKKAIKRRGMAWRFWTVADRLSRPVGM